MATYFIAASYRPGSSIAGLTNGGRFAPLQLSVGVALLVIGAYLVKTDFWTRKP